MTRFSEATFDFSLSTTERHKLHIRFRNCPKKKCNSYVGWPSNVIRRGMVNLFIQVSCWWCGCKIVRACLEMGSSQTIPDAHKSCIRCLFMNVTGDRITSKLKMHDRSNKIDRLVAILFRDRQLYEKWSCVGFHCIPKIVSFASTLSSSETLSNHCTYCKMLSKLLAYIINQNFPRVHNEINCCWSRCSFLN